MRQRIFSARLLLVLGVAALCLVCVGAVTASSEHLRSALAPTASRSTSLEPTSAASASSAEAAEVDLLMRDLKALREQGDGLSSSSRAGAGAAGDEMGEQLDELDDELQQLASMTRNQGPAPASSSLEAEDVLLRRAEGLRDRIELEAVLAARQRDRALAETQHLLEEDRMELGTGRSAATEGITRVRTTEETSCPGGCNHKETTEVLSSSGSQSHPVLSLAAPTKPATTGKESSSSSEAAASSEEEPKPKPWEEDSNVEVISKSEATEEQAMEIAKEKEEEQEELKNEESASAASREAGLDKGEWVPPETVPLNSMQNHNEERVTLVKHNTLVSNAPSNEAHLVKKGELNQVLSSGPAQEGHPDPKLHKMHLTNNATVLHHAKDVKNGTFSETAGAGKQGKKQSATSSTAKPTPRTSSSHSPGTASLVEVSESLSLSSSARSDVLTNTLRTKQLAVAVSHGKVSPVHTTTPVYDMPTLQGRGQGESEVQITGASQTFTSTGTEVNSAAQSAAGPATSTTAQSAPDGENEQPQRHQLEEADTVEPAVSADVTRQQQQADQVARQQAQQLADGAHAESERVAKTERREEAQEKASELADKAAQQNADTASANAAKAAAQTAGAEAGGAASDAKLREEIEQAEHSLASLEDLYGAAETPSDMQKYGDELEAAEKRLGKLKYSYDKLHSTVESWGQP